MNKIKGIQSLLAGAIIGLCAVGSWLIWDCRVLGDDIRLNILCWLVLVIITGLISAGLIITACSCGE